MEIVIPIYSTEGIENEITLSIDSPYCRKRVTFDCVEYSVIGDFLQFYCCKNYDGFSTSSTNYQNIKSSDYAINKHRGAYYDDVQKQGWEDCELSEITDVLKRSIVTLQNDLLLLEPDQEL
jgi:hypothetical protein